MTKLTYYLLAFTAWLVVMGAMFNAVGSPGWAQFCWVGASGTAGVFVIKIIDKEPGDREEESMTLRDVLLIAVLVIVIWLLVLTIA